MVQPAHTKEDCLKGTVPSFQAKEQKCAQDGRHQSEALQSLLCSVTAAQWCACHEVSLGM